jgi:hypothetical protein
METTGGLVFPNIIVNATTGGPDLAGLITPAQELRDKTRCCVFLEDGAGAVTMLVYRDSSTAPELWSCDVYERLGGRWVRTGEGEDPEKFKPLFATPAGIQAETGIQAEIGGVPFWSHQPIDAERRRWFEELIEAAGVVAR